MSNLHNLKLGDVISQSILDKQSIYIVTLITDTNIKLKNILDAEIYELDLNAEFEYTLLYNENYIMDNSPKVSNIIKTCVTYMTTLSSNNDLTFDNKTFVRTMSYEEYEASIKTDTYVEVMSSTIKCNSVDLLEHAKNFVAKYDKYRLLSILVEFRDKFENVVYVEHYLECNRCDMIGNSINGETEVYMIG